MEDGGNGFFWFLASENRCTVIYIIDLFLEKLCVASVQVLCKRE